MVQLTSSGGEKISLLEVSLYPALTVSKENSLTIKARLLQLTSSGVKKSHCLKFLFIPH
ncbi:hypothetical protein [Lysinibacillus parviboronicapiens]|uniref:hypothetical protein n=1 Tax=Lysinibacillus parviboronicapiens TaxID=436516 RepID=UPI00187D5E5B|nr:hypothetical protein [Lysinibacillus parviboronicapiens]